MQEDKVGIRKCSQLAPELDTECKCMLIWEAKTRLPYISSSILRRRLIGSNAKIGKNNKRIIKGIGNQNAPLRHPVPKVGGSIRTEGIRQDCRSQLVSGSPDYNTVCPSAVYATYPIELHSPCPSRDVARANYYIDRDTRIEQEMLKQVQHDMGGTYCFAIN
jgi:hypothetical protein